MAAEPSTKERAWPLFDRIVADATTGGEHSNPWAKGENERLRYEPDLDTLVRLLGVPLYLKADTTTGVPALALDVWLSYELRRAGFNQDAVWPRAVHPRILPGPIAALLRELPAVARKPLNERLTAKAGIKGVTAASASILGKNYLKQVDVIMTDWHTGPELLISTKRMDSSYGRNAANRVEESYGDAKNLRLRHPLAALGFLLGLRSDVLDNRERAEWLIDLLAKLGREDDAYHATCLVMFEYADAAAVPADTGEDPENPLVAAGLEPDPEEDEEPIELPESEVERALAQLPAVVIRDDEMPEHVAPAKFLATMVERVLDTTPVNMHAEARKRRREAPRV